jgi:hypothetical protein
MPLAESKNAAPSTAAHAVGCAFIILLLPSEVHGVRRILGPPAGKWVDATMNYLSKFDAN